ncbi:MAG: hypothetical protein ACI89L_001880 [Phycisphaerales bacterium]|jgi:hypothetical protein
MKHTPHTRGALLSLGLVGSALATAPASAQLILDDRQIYAGDAAHEDEFGWSVALDGGVIAVGAARDDEIGEDSGSAYLYNAKTGAFINKMTPDDGMPGAEFGNAIAIHGGVVAVGAWLDAENGTNAGAVYLFDQSTGAQTHKLLPSDGSIEDRFGHSVAIDDGRVAVGMLFQADRGYRSGAAYLFDANTGVQKLKLLADDGNMGDWFGSSVAMADGVVAVGARLDDDDGLQAGSAYLFDSTTGAQITKMLPRDGDQGNEFGNAIALEGGVAVVGSVYADLNAELAGSVYVFSVPGQGCRADVNNDGILDYGDLGQFVAGFLVGDLASDINGDGIIDLGDIGGFIELFLAGC